MGAKEVRAGGAYVEVSTKDKTAGGLAGIAKKVSALSSKIRQVGGLATGGAVAAATETVMRAVQTGSAIKDMADRFGLSYAAVQQLGFVADQTGSSVETLAVGIKKMQQGLGNGTLTKELEGIGLSLADIQGKSPEQQFAMIATAIGKIADPAKKTAAAMAIFGKSGSDLVPLTGEIGKLMSEFDALGITMGDAAVEQAEAFGDELDKLGKQFDAVVVKIGGALMPALEKVAAILDRLAQPDLARNSEGNVTIGVRRMARGRPSSDQLENEWRASLQQEGGYDASSSPINRFLAEMQARAARMNQGAKDREQATAYRGVIDIFLGVAKEADRIGRSADRAANKERIRERRAIEGDLTSVNKQIAEEMAKNVSFGSFDKRDLMGGVFNDIGHQQLKELRDSKKLLEKQLDALQRLKPGLPVG
jgi:hypothetical protein